MADNITQGQRQEAPMTFLDSLSAELTEIQSDINMMTTKIVNSKPQFIPPPPDPQFNTLFKLGATISAMGGDTRQLDNIFAQKAAAEQMRQQVAMQNQMAAYEHEMQITEFQLGALKDRERNILDTIRAGQSAASKAGPTDVDAVVNDLRHLRRTAEEIMSNPTLAQDIATKMNGGNVETLGAVLKSLEGVDVDDNLLNYAQWYNGNAGRAYFTTLDEMKAGVKTDERGNYLDAKGEIVQSRESAAPMELEDQLDKIEDLKLSLTVISPRDSRYRELQNYVDTLDERVKIAIREKGINDAKAKKMAEEAAARAEIRAARKNYKEWKIAKDIDEKGNYSHPFFGVGEDGGPEALFKIPVPFSVRNLVNFTMDAISRTPNLLEFGVSEALSDSTFVERIDRFSDVAREGTSNRLGGSK